MIARLVCFAALAVVLSMPLRAEETTEPPLPAASPRAKVVTLKGKNTSDSPINLRGPMPAVAETIRLSVNKSTDVLLPAEVKDVIVGNSDIADVVVRSPTRIHVVGRAAGLTNIFLMDRAGRTMKRMEVEVGLDAETVREVLRQVLPEERNIQVSAVSDSLYLSGTVRTDGAAATARTLARRFVGGDSNLVNLLRVSNDQQVLLHVKVVEMQRTVVKELGVGVTSKAINLGTPQLTGVSTTSTIGQITTSYFGAGTVTGLGPLTANLNLLENQGLIRTLVEPNLTAVSGETATMLAGGEIPMPVSDTNGALSIEFKPYGVLLNFTPTVLDPGRLSLKMSTEVSALDSTNKIAIGTTGTTVPAFKVRRAGSTVELPSGGSIMIAGLLQNDLTGNISGLPGLMDIPVLGALFRSAAFQRNETELVVILSAYVVQSVNRPDILALPSDGFAPASDLKILLLGRLQDTYTKRGAVPVPLPGQLQGPYGYIVQ